MHKNPLSHMLSRLFSSDHAAGKSDTGTSPATGKPSNNNKGASNTAPIASNVFMAAMFLTCWLWPNWLNAHQVQYLSLMTLMEIIMVMMMFFLIPILMIELGKKLKYFMTGFILFFFSIFIVGMSVGVGEYMVIFFFAYAVLNKVLAIRRLQLSASLPWALGIDWIGSVIVMFITLIIAFGIPMPELGLSHAADYFDKTEAARLNMQIEFGAYEKEPQQAMAFGLIFYALQAYMQTLKARWADRRVSL